MTDVPAPRGGSSATPPTVNVSFLGEQLQPSLAPKLAALLTQFRRLEDLEHQDVEPAPPIPERWDGDERR